MIKKYFKVQKGYQVDDYISVDEVEVITALRAQINGGVAIFKEGTISGNHIISITPDYSRMMGLNKGYQLTSEDYARIGKGTINDCQKFLEGIKIQASGGSAPQLQEKR